jgi:hypothetical protein
MPNGPSMIGRIVAIGLKQSILPKAGVQVTENRVIRMIVISVAIKLQEPIVLMLSLYRYLTGR